MQPRKQHNGSGMDQGRVGGAQPRGCGFDPRPLRLCHSVLEQDVEQKCGSWCCAISRWSALNSIIGGKVLYNKNTISSSSFQRKLSNKVPVHLFLIVPGFGLQSWKRVDEGLLFSFRHCNSALKEVVLPRRQSGEPMSINPNRTKINTPAWTFKQTLARKHEHLRPRS